jgi:hypothetical protein
MYRTAQRTPGEHIWFGISLAFNLVGIAGVAEDALKWKSFLSNVLLYYRRYVTDPIHDALAWLWPDFFFFPLPYAVSDAVVLMAGFFAAANFYTIQTEGTSVIERLRTNHCREGGFMARCACLISSVVALYVFGPIIYVRAFLSGPQRIHRVLGFVFCPAQVLRYYLILAVSAVSLIFILSQFGI